MRQPSFLLRLIYDQLIKKTNYKINLRVSNDHPMAEELIRLRNESLIYYWVLKPKIIGNTRAWCKPFHTLLCIPLSFVWQILLLEVDKHIVAWKKINFCNNIIKMRVIYMLQLPEKYSNPEIYLFKTNHHGDSNYQELWLWWVS